jgi:hypothetical protein
VVPSRKGRILLASNKSRGGYFKDAQRHSTKCVRAMVVSVAKYLKDQNLRFQQLVMDKFLYHPLVKDFLPPYLENIADLKRSYEIVGNFKKKLLFISLVHTSLILLW